MSRPPPNFSRPSSPLSDPRKCIHANTSMEPKIVDMHPEIDPTDKDALSKLETTRSEFKKDLWEITRQKVHENKTLTPTQYYTTVFQKTDKYKQAPRIKSSPQLSPSPQKLDTTNQPKKMSKKGPVGQNSTFDEVIEVDETENADKNIPAVEEIVGNKSIRI
eukprot:239351-Ditylum_brightwellii.AAC.1